MMSNPAFIVDGFTEKILLERLCPNKPVKRTDCNGKDVKLSVMAERIASHIRLLGNRHYPIIILVDKEERVITHEKMAEELRLEIEKQGIKNHDLRIGVADRMIENWILADWEKLFGSLQDKPQLTDGCNGSAMIKKRIGHYDKVKDGVAYFLAARQDILYENSPSYRYFIDQLGDLVCNYLDFEKENRIVET